MVDFVPKGNADNFYLTLKNLYQEVKDEWIFSGNMAKNFISEGPKKIVVLDNASFHKKKEILDRIPKVQLIRKAHGKTKGVFVMTDLILASFKLLFKTPFVLTSSIGFKKR